MTTSNTSAHVDIQEMLPITESLAATNLKQNIDYEASNGAILESKHVAYITISTKCISSARNKDTFTISTQAETGSPQLNMVSAQATFPGIIGQPTVVVVWRVYHMVCEALRFPVRCVAYKNKE